MHNKEKKISTAVPLAPLLLARKKRPVLAAPWDFMALGRNMRRRDCALWPEFSQLLFTVKASDYFAVPLSTAKRSLLGTCSQDGSLA